MNTTKKCRITFIINARVALTRGYHLLYVVVGIVVVGHSTRGNEESNHKIDLHYFGLIGFSKGRQRRE